MRTYETRPVAVDREVLVSAACDGCSIPEDDAECGLTPVAIEVNLGGEFGARDEYDFCNGCLVEHADRLKAAGSRSWLVAAPDEDDEDANAEPLPADEHGAVEAARKWLAAVRDTYPMSDATWLRTVMFPDGPDGPHLYLSTGCLHGNGQHCRSDRALSGETKQTSTCKFCPAPCVAEHDAPEGP